MSITSRREFSLRNTKVYMYISFFVQLFIKPETPKFKLQTKICQWLGQDQFHELYFANMQEPERNVVEKKKSDFVNSLLILYWSSEQRIVNPKGSPSPIFDLRFKFSRDRISRDFPSYWRQTSRKYHVLGSWYLDGIPRKVSSIRDRLIDFIGELPP